MKDPALLNPNLNANLPPVTPTDVSVIRMKNYIMPGTCVVCNAPKSMGHKVQAGHTIQYGRTQVSLSLDFPVCPDCGSVQDEFIHNARIGAAIGGGLAVLGAIIYYIVLTSSTGAKFSENCGAFFCYPIIGFFALWFVAYQALNLLLPKQVRERKKRIDKSVKIVFFDGMYVNYQFQNAIYAELFRTLNTIPAGTDLSKLVNPPSVPPTLGG
jgi:hypothetical protein